MATFLNMGGYAAYVWAAFGITLVTLAGNCWWARYRFQKIVAEIGRADTPEPSIRRPVITSVK